MSTRHISAEGDYPFVPPLTGSIQDLAKGLLDMYIVIQGSPSGSGPAIDYPTTTLQSAVASGAGCILTFRSTFTDGSYWEYTFTVTDFSIDGTIEQLSPVGGDVTGMLVYTATRLSEVTYPVNTVSEIEPARVQWHVESTAEILFQNITRCNSVEDEDTLVDVLNTNELGDDVIRIEDGYNTKVSLVEGSLVFEGGAGLGKGRMPDLGNTDTGVCPEPALDAVVEGVLTINGLLPENGNIALEVSKELYLERTPGRILVKKRQQT